MLKVRPNPLSRKRDNPKFSTFTQITCGGQWTTQRFVAFDRVWREPNGPQANCASNNAQDRLSESFRLANCDSGDSHRRGQSDSMIRVFRTGQRRVARLAIALSEQLQAQRIQLDEAFSVMLIIGAGIIFEGHMRF